MIKSFLYENRIRLVIAFILGVILYTVYLSVKNAWALLLGHIDALFFASILLVLFGLLSLVLNLGAFDIFSYQFGRRRIDGGKKEDLYEYSQRKKLERTKNKFSFVSYFIVSVPFIIAFAVLYIIFTTTIA